MKEISKRRHARPWVWVSLFILALVVAGVLATLYNVELVFPAPTSRPFPYQKMIWGGAGFLFVLFSFVLFFLKARQEMRISQLQSEFLDRISHELRTPLSTLTLVSDLLRNEQLTPVERENLWRSFEVELDRVKTDVEMLLQASRLRSDRFDVHLESVDFMKWWSEQEDSLKWLLGEGAELTVEGMQNLKGRVKMDRKLFELIFRNLFDNARKFSSGQAQVLVSIGNQGRKFCIRIRDFGEGIREEDHDKMFQRFSRFSRKTTPGTGLGLYLSLSAARAMGVELSAKSKGAGHGTEFLMVGEYSHES